MMKKLPNIASKKTKNILTVCFALLFIFGLGIGEASAGCSREKHTYANVYHKEANSSFINGTYTSEEQKQAQAQLKELEKKLDSYVYNICLGIDAGWLGKLTAVNPSTISRYLAEHNDDKNGESSFNALQKQYVDAMKVLNPQEKEELSDNHCSKANPKGCGAGEKCWRKTFVSSGASVNGGGNTDADITYVCAKENPCSSAFSGCRAQEATEADPREEEHTHAGVGDLSIAQLHNDGTEDYYHANFAKNMYTGDYFGYEHTHVDEDGIMTYEDTSWENTLTNKECDIEGQKKAYLGTCYSCTIVANLIRVFMNAAAKTAPLTQEAGVKILAIGMVLWFAFFVLQKISSFVSIEPMKMLQELFTFLFKCVLVYTVITSGLLNIINMMVNPILTAGADYGITMIDSVTEVNLDYTSVDQKEYKIGSGELINQKVFDKIMKISKKADAAMSINFVIGNAIMCHSRHAGAIVIPKKVTDTANLPPFHFPDFWLWICGALIWFFAFMVTMGINFYLLDLSFKIGFALLALPITLGLWPFNRFKGKFVECLKIIVNAAGTFMFLGITAAISIVLISSALGGTEQLFEAIKADNKEYISQKFALTGSSFLLILFAFIYSHNLISKTVSKLTDKFFGSVTSGMNVMHSHTVEMIDRARHAAMTVATAVTAPIGGAAAGAVKNAAGAVAKKAARSVVKSAMKLGRAGGRGSKGESSES